MDDKPTKPSGGTAVLVLVAVLLLLPTFHVLSMGPLALLVAEGFMPKRIFRGFYYPVIWVSEQNLTTTSMLDWYLELWV